MENTNKGETFQTTQSMGLTEMRKQRDELVVQLEKDKKDGKNIYNIERNIGDLNELINTHPQSGCGETCRVSQITDETFVCGKDKLDGQIWLCNDCLHLERMDGLVQISSKTNLKHYVRNISKDLRIDGFETDDIKKYILSLVEEGLK